MWAQWHLEDSLVRESSYFLLGFLIAQQEAEGEDGS